jgi:hypothetical protein
LPSFCLYLVCCLCLGQYLFLLNVLGRIDPFVFYGSVFPCSHCVCSIAQIWWLL